MLFEGQKDHLIPCVSQPLLDSDLFMMAGRMVGHSFIHGGPGLAKYPWLQPADGAHMEGAGTQSTSRRLSRFPLLLLMQE